jgi:hypothetical protein
MVPRRLKVTGSRPSLADSMAGSIGGADFGGGIGGSSSPEMPVANDAGGPTKEKAEKVKKKNEDSKKRAGKIRRLAGDLPERHRIGLVS